MKGIAHKITRRQPKVTTEMNGKGLTVHAGLLPVLTFMGKLLFRERIHEAVHKERGANAQYEFTDIVQMVVIGLIAGATSMVQVVKVWADDVLRKMAGWEAVPVDTTIGRIMKMVGKGDIVELTGTIHKFRGKVWKRAIRSGQKLRSVLSEMWIEECKSQMNAGHLRTGEFLANAALFHCAVLAYNLLKWMGLLAGGVIQRWEIKTVRLWLIRVAGKLTKGSRQLTLKLPEKFLHQEEWRLWEGMSLSVEFG